MKKTKLVIATRKCRIYLFSLLSPYGGKWFQNPPPQGDLLSIFFVFMLSSVINLGFYSIGFIRQPSVRKNHDAHRRMSFKAHQMSWSGSQAAVMLFKPDVHWKMKTRVTLPVTNTQNRIPFEHAVNTIENFGLEVNRIVVQSQHTHTHTRAPI